jgi:hypothetical protein
VMTSCINQASSGDDDRGQAKFHRDAGGVLPVVE